MPPIPEGLERLRDAGNAIDAAATFRLALPDGSVLEVTGAELIATAGTLVSLADAQRVGDESGIRRAVERLSGEPVGRGLIVCMRVGSAAHVPPGTQLSDCTRCGHAVWIAPESADLGRLTGAVPVCSVCFGWPK